MGNSYFVQIAKEGQSHMLFEKTAKIFPAESNIVRGIFQRKLFRIMFIYIRNQFADGTGAYRRPLYPGTFPEAVSGGAYSEKY